MRYSKSTARALSVKPFLSLCSSPSERFYRVLNGKIVVLTLGIALFGLLMIYSASSYVAKKNFGDPFYYVKKQAVALFVGTAAMFGV